MARSYDIRLAAKAPTCTIQWTIAGRQMALSIQTRDVQPKAKATRQSTAAVLLTQAPAHTAPKTPAQPAPRPRPNPPKSSSPPRVAQQEGASGHAMTGTHPDGADTRLAGRHRRTLVARATLDEQTALRLHRLFGLDSIMSLSRQYVNTCDPEAKQTELVIETPKRTQTIQLKGYLPPAVDILWNRLMDHFPRRVRIDAGTALRACLVPQSRQQQTTRPGGLSPDACVTEEVGMVHDPVDSFKIGRPAIIAALAPKTWRLVLHVQTDVTHFYRDIPMACKGCVCSAEIPQDLLTEGTLYYYITAENQAGKQVDSAASKSSPNIVEVRSCLKFD